MKEKINLSGVPETMLQTVYARAKESGGRGAVHDVKAEELIEKVDYDFSLLEQKSRSLMQRFGFLEVAMCHLDYTMSEAGGVTDFVREYTLASGGPYCDCGYKKKNTR